MPETQTTQKDPVIVVLQLTGGNDYLNTVIPYNNPLYRDNRKAVGIPDNQTTTAPDRAVVVFLEDVSFLRTLADARNACG
jgi:uncharacterized protein (DUF1501 family)